jgi:thiol-disulfide isomerase/thioredoxin
MKLARALLPVLFLLPAACTGADSGTAAPVTPDSSPAVSPFVDCDTLTATPSASTTSAGQTGTAESPTPAAGEARLPALSLPCFTGDRRVDLAELRGPAVINLWASWCAPCRKELPVLQRFADRAAGQVHVLGVNVTDRRAAAQSLGTDLGLSFPNLADADDELRRALGRQVIPITLFVDAAGRIRHLDTSGALDDATLATLAQRHLGVMPR